MHTRTHVRNKLYETLRVCTYVSASMCTCLVSPESLASSEGQGEGKSYGGYTDLHGEIVTVTVNKVCKKLGIAIDGGANTKQKAVIIREISVSIY